MSYLKLRSRYGVYSVSESINAGLDLEMPGDDRWRTVDHTTRSVASRKILTRTIKERANKVLQLVQKCAKGAPEVLISLQRAFANMAN